MSLESIEKLKNRSLVECRIVELFKKYVGRPTSFSEPYLILSLGASHGSDKLPDMACDSMAKPNGATKRNKYFQLTISCT